MTPERAQKLLPIIRAYAEGKTIQIQYPNSEEWKNISEPDWVCGCEYRIAPEPKIIYVNRYTNGQVNFFENEETALADSCADPDLLESGPVKYIEASD